MTDKLTWAEFVEKYQPEQGDKFLDDRGNKWHYRKYGRDFGRDFCCETVENVVNLETIGKILTCPLIPPKKNRKVWPAMVRFHFGDCWHISRQLFESETQAKEWFNRDATVLWPAIPGPDGSYEVPE